jgi:hypothetical protein
MELLWKDRTSHLHAGILSHKSTIKDDDQIPPKKRRLTDFFMKETAEEREDRLARSWEDLRIAQDRRDRNVILEAEERAERVREGNRIRKAKQRALIKAKKGDSLGKRVRCINSFMRLWKLTGIKRNL